VCADAIIGVSIFGLQSHQDFGRFEQAFVAMFRLTTDGNWPDSIQSHDEDGNVNWKCAIFMMSYIVIVNWVVLQAHTAIPPATSLERPMASHTLAGTQLPLSRVCSICTVATLVSRDC
jgi:hypothetical protein